MPLKEPILSIHSIDDILRCLNLTSLLEISGWPKPGNIHCTHDFKDTRFEHLLAGIIAIQPNFRVLCKNILKNPSITADDYSFVNLGRFYKEAVEQMMKWQSGGNVILGHILILAPLASAAMICLKMNENKFDNFIYNLKKIIEDATVEDTVNLYKAIKTCKPGGMGKIDKYDLNDENSIDLITRDKIDLKKIFDLSREYDLISQEYSTGFEIILNEGLPYYLDVFYQIKDINTATVNTFLKILAEHPDTLIIRKSGLKSAIDVSNRAKEIVENGGVSTEKGLNLTLELDKYLQSKKGQMNPGTTADLVAGIIFCALIFGLKY